MAARDAFRFRDIRVDGSEEERSSNDGEHDREAESEDVNIRI